MPFLLPPSEFKPGELISQGLTGTCEMQIVRSAGPWSMGTLNKVERSIQNAYLKGMLLFTTPLSFFSQPMLDTYVYYSHPDVRAFRLY